MYGMVRCNISMIASIWLFARSYTTTFQWNLSSKRRHDIRRDKKSIKSVFCTQSQCIWHSATLVCHRPNVLVCVCLYHEATVCRLVCRAMFGIVHIHVHSLPSSSTIIVIKCFDMYLLETNSPQSHCVCALCSLTHTDTRMRLRFSAIDHRRVVATIVHNMLFVSLRRFVYYSDSRSFIVLDFIERMH